MMDTGDYYVLSLVFQVLGLLITVFIAARRK
jgi:hypothetical protein